VKCFRPLTCGRERKLPGSACADVPPRTRVYRTSAARSEPKQDRNSEAARPAHHCVEILVVILVQRRNGIRVAHPHCQHVQFLRHIQIQQVEQGLVQAGPFAYD
jgi:hypothetical protein